MKNFLLLCGSILLCTASLSAQTTWNCGASGNNVTATLSGDTLTISGSGNMADYMCSPYNITSAPWGIYSASIQTVIINNGVTSIGECAFDGCRNLISVDIPNSVTSIGELAFCGCRSLTSLNIPNSVTSIGNYAFYSCSSLTSIDIPNSLKSMGRGIFYECRSLTSIDIPNSVTTIGELAFCDCSNLTTVHFLSGEIRLQLIIMP